MKHYYPTPSELADLRSAMGGRTTHFGTAEHARFQAMADVGWVKEVTLVADGVAWKLSGDGLSFAYAAERASSEAVRG